MAREEFREAEPDAGADAVSVDFFDAPFLRKTLADIWLALESDRLVFLLGAPGSGKTTLARQLIDSFDDRRQAAWLLGSADLRLDDVVRVLPPRADPHSGSTTVVLVEEAQSINPALMSEMIALADGKDPTIPPHRLLFIATPEFVGTLRARLWGNAHGPAVVISLAPWPADAVAPFVQPRLTAAMGSGARRLTAADMRMIAERAAGNPGDMLDIARRLCLTSGPTANDREDPPAVAGDPARHRNPIALPRSVSDALLFADVSAKTKASPANQQDFARLARTIGKQSKGKRFGVTTVGVPARLAIAAGVLACVSIGWYASTSRGTSPVATTAAIQPKQVASAPIEEAVLIVTSEEPVVPFQATAASRPPAPDPTFPAAVVPETTSIAEAAPSDPLAISPAPTENRAAALMTTGDELLARGDFAAARAFYLRAVQDGGSRAAAAVAQTYDPVALRRHGVVGSQGEPESAVFWYRKAVELGDGDASEPLRRLTAR
jgi:hypothetical protein